MISHMGSKSSHGTKATCGVFCYARDEISSLINDFLEDSPSGEASESAGNDSRIPADGSMSTSVASVYGSKPSIPRLFRSPYKDLN